MGFVPGLNEALGKLDATSEKMDELVGGIGRVIELLEEQNTLLQKDQTHV